MPLSQALIADFFDKNEMTKVTGYSTAASNFMGVVSSIFVGAVSVINWRYDFYVYIIALVPLI